MSETKDNRCLSVDKHKISQYSAGLICPPAVFTQSALRSRVHDSAGADSVSTAGC